METDDLRNAIEILKQHKTKWICIGCGEEWYVFDTETGDLIEDGFHTCDYCGKEIINVR
jgi:hypothetical protein